MKKLMSILCLFAVLLGCVAVAGAQTQITSGVIQGTVTDQSGAVISGANVEIKNLDTNFTKNLTADEGGRFVGLLLPPGRYEVTVKKDGFGTLVQQNLNLTVGQNISLALAMQVAAASERIIVTSSPTVDVVKTESSSTLNQRAVENTPVLGRKFEDLLTLTPGVSITQGPDGDEINFNGQRGIFNNVSLDGGDYNNGFFGEQAGGQRAAVDISLEAIKEFQVIAAGSSAEFGRTAGGVVNVITKSGTNELHGSIFHFQRLESLTADTSTGEPLKDFHREQSGATIGGPIVKDKAFFFLNGEHIGENFERANLSQPIPGSAPCPVAAPTVIADAALIDANPDCQRLALTNFFRTSLNSEEANPVRRPIHNTAILGKLDWNLNALNLLSASYSFDISRNVNQTFDVPTYGNSANGTEGTSTINALNVNLVSTITPKVLSEAHFTFSRENRPRAAAKSNVLPDVAIGGLFDPTQPTFRFGNPFFLQPGIDELFKRYQGRDNISIVTSKHNIKLGGEYMFSNNAQVFRGFFTGRYIFSTVTGFLRYVQPGGNVSDINGLVLYLQGAGPNGPATDAAGASDINNHDIAAFVQDKWQILPNLSLSYGLRWEAQLLPDPITPPSQTAYGVFLGNPAFPSNGTLPDQWKQFQPRVGFAWDVLNNRKSVLRGSWGIYNGHQNMLTQVGSITTNGVQQQTIAGGLFANPTIAPVFPGLVTPTASSCTDGTITNPFPCFSGVRVFDKDYANPRIYTTNVAYEQEILPDLTAYVDFTHSKGVHLTRFVNANRPEFGNPFGIILGEVMVTQSTAQSLYRGVTFGVRKRFSHGFQLDSNYTYSKDYDDDSNERDPFTDRVTDPLNFRKDYSLSDRDIAHRFNLALSGDLPFGFQGNMRIQAHGAQPITASPRVVGGVDLGRNSLRKDNAFSSVDWRVSRPIKFGERYSIVPTAEMFNTFNSDNNVNPLTTPGLFNFDGFLRQGVGDPRQLQLAVKFIF